MASIEVGNRSSFDGSTLYNVDRNVFVICKLQKEALNLKVPSQIPVYTPPFGIRAEKIYLSGGTYNFLKTLTNKLSCTLNSNNNSDIQTFWRAEINSDWSIVL